MRGCWRGAVFELCQPSAFFSPIDIQPPLEKTIPWENTEVLIMQIPEEPSHMDQPVTSDMGTLEVSQEPNTETAGDPGKAC